MDVHADVSQHDDSSDNDSASSWTPSDEDEVRNSRPVIPNSGAALQDDDDLLQSTPSSCAADPISREQGQAETPSYHEGEQPVRKKRAYKYLSRIPAAPQPPSRRSKWMDELSTTTAASLKRQKCCKYLRCFAHVNYDFFVKTATNLFTVSTQTRRDILNFYLDSDKCFRFDRRVVCVTFLKEGLHFSSFMIAEVASGKVTRPTTSRSSMSSGIKTLQSANETTPSLSSTTTESPSDEPLKRKKEAIISFVLRIAQDCGDNMPHKSEVHLPFHQVHELCPVFDREFRKLYPPVEPVSKAYFRRIWLSNCPSIKVMRSSRFTVCDVCDMLRSRLRESVIKGESTSQLKEQRKAHISFISAERMAYQVKKDRYKLHSAEYCSIIIDGADQSAFGLPHFTTTPKSQRGHSMKVKLPGILEHRLKNRLYLYTMTQEHQTCANHVVESLHRFLLRKRQEGPLPRHFFIQLDNCSRENKNRFVMGFLEILVADRVFDSIECGFLPVGHTHEDVDQAFSTTSSRLRVRNAITLTDIHHELSFAYSGNVEVEHMRRVANWSGLCNDLKCLRKIDRMSNWRYFLFTPGPSTISTSVTKPRSTTCSVKKDCNGQWERLFSSSLKPDQGGILREFPDLSKTPPLEIACPDGLHDINKRLWSEEGRVYNNDKMIDLHERRYFVFQDRVDNFHWDLSRSVETEFIRTQSALADPMCDDDQSSPTLAGDAAHVAETESNVQATPRNTNADITVEELNATEQATRVPQTPNSKVDYAMGSFVLVSNDDSDESANSFWVAKVVSVSKDNNTSYVTDVVVQWYDRDSDTLDPLHAKYHPHYQPRIQPRKKKKKTAESSSKPSRSTEARVNRRNTH